MKLRLSNSAIPLPKRKFKEVVLDDDQSENFNKMVDAVNKLRENSDAMIVVELLSDAGVLLVNRLML